MAAVVEHESLVLRFLGLELGLLRLLLLFLLLLLLCSFLGHLRLWVLFLLLDLLVEHAKPGHKVLPVVTVSRSKSLKKSIDFISSVTDMAALEKGPDNVEASLINEARHLGQGLLDGVGKIFSAEAVENLDGGVAGDVVAK